MKKENGRARIARRLAWLIVPLAPLALTTGCGTDVFNVGVDLSAQTYSTDFGATQGSIPDIACDPAQPDACLAGAGTAQASTSGGSAQVQLGCDPATARCFAQAQAVQTFPIDLLQEDDFVTTVKRFAVVVVRSVDVAYRVPINTLTFDVPQIRVSVGPAGTQSESDPSVVPIGTTAPLPAGTTIGDPPMHLVLADGTPARALIEDSIRNKRTFVIVAALAPRLEAGAPIPAGQLQAIFTPHLTLGPP